MSLKESCPDIDTLKALTGDLKDEIKTKSFFKTLIFLRVLLEQGSLTHVLMALDETLSTLRVIRRPKNLVVDGDVNSLSLNFVVLRTKRLRLHHGALTDSKL